MPTHPVFTDLLLHSDAELESLLDKKILEREMVHAWPLSCVERLRLEDGSQLAYKSQLPPTVETRFYEQASSPLLPGHRYLGRLGDCETMLLDWIEAPLLRDVALTEAELVAHGRRVVEQIGQTRGTWPVYLDIGTIEAWAAAGQKVFDKQRQLIEDGRFRLTDLAGLKQVWAWAGATETLRAIAAHPWLAHGDLTAGQIFVAEDQYRVIDWQRPVIAPPEIDLVGLLVDREIDPRPYVAGPVIAIFWFLRLHWAVEAQFDLFPAFKGHLFDQWAAQATAHILNG
ncbi:MAG: phosphotransferase [Chloroflexi bacterium]|nr:phosphotransferase [Chloroflexota bacterium]OJV92352.1 MAG: hypothetical protein BGO39_30955 [Chloroflexi bacterium 54-19]